MLGVLSRNNTTQTQVAILVLTKPKANGWTQLPFPSNNIVIIQLVILTHSANVPY